MEISQFIVNWKKIIPHAPVLIILVLTGCFLSEDFKTTPGIVTSDISETQERTPWPEMTSPHRVVIDSLSLYHFYELLVYDVVNEVNHVEITTALHLGKFFALIGDTVFIDKDGITEFLAPNIIPLELRVNLQFLSKNKGLVSGKY